MYEERMQRQNGLPQTCETLWSSGLEVHKVWQTVNA